MAYEITGIIGVFHEQFARQQAVFLVKSSYGFEIKAIKVEALVFGIMFS